MAVYLNEQQAGCDREVVGFPHIVVCLGVVLQTNAWLYGYHFDFGNDVGNIAAFRDFLRDVGGNAQNGVRLYGAADWTERYVNAANRRQAWRNEMQQIAAAIGYRGRISGFNTDIIGPQNGTYVEYQANFGAETCKIFYKRNEKMMDFEEQRHEVGPRPRNVVTYRCNGDQMQRNPGALWLVRGAGVRPTRGNEGRLHELNYFLRLTSFDYNP